MFEELKKAYAEMQAFDKECGEHFQKAKEVRAEGKRGFSLIEKSEKKLGYEARRKYNDKREEIFFDLVDLVSEGMEISARETQELFDTLGYLYD